jgi:DnaK suppressor protein
LHIGRSGFTLSRVDHLTAEQRAELERALRAAREEIGRRLDAEAEVGAPDEHRGDIQDDAAQQMRRRQSLDRSERDVGHLEEIDAALRRLADGSYGICEETGEDISFARLRLQPTTRYTVEALEQLELERARARVVGPDDDEKAY